MTPGADASFDSDPPLVRLRVRVLRQVDRDGDPAASSTVFCPARHRSLAIDTCLGCEHLCRALGDAIECVPARGQPDGRDPGPPNRLGEDAWVGDAMGAFALAVHVALPLDGLRRAFEEAAAAVALVVDDRERLAGVVEDTLVARMKAPARAIDLARRVQPVHESERLVHAIDRMIHERARALPVIDDDGCVVALLTDLDALRWVAQRGHRA